jgi:amidase
MAIAAQLDEERASARGARGPLHGIPILLKDNIDTADHMTTTAGSLAMAGSVPERDAFLAERLRKAGAILLGKANLSEWANIRSTRSSSGWSARGGQARNPMPDRNRGSSRLAAAVSANLAPQAIGTETDGSIVCPSSANGIVGIKPTLGLGAAPASSPSRIVGHGRPMARTVATRPSPFSPAPIRDGATAASAGTHPDHAAWRRTLAAPRKPASSSAATRVDAIRKRRSRP